MSAGTHSGEKTPRSKTTSATHRAPPKPKQKDQNHKRPRLSDVLILEMELCRRGLTTMCHWHEAGRCWHPKCKRCRTFAVSHDIAPPPQLSIEPCMILKERAGGTKLYETRKAINCSFSLLHPFEQGGAYCIYETRNV